MNEIRNIFLTEVSAEIKKPKYTLILCHKSPDPDTLGSAFGLKILLEHFGSKVVVACADKPSPRFDFITGGSTLEYKEDTYERIIAVDVASPMQLGDLEFLAPRVEITIDHHAMNTRFSNYYEMFCAACAEIIMELAQSTLRIFDALPMQFYNCVYAGISGDTGCFKYSNTNYRTMKFGADLIAKGIDHAEINRIIFDSKTQGEIRALKLLYERIEYFYNGQLAIALFTNEDKQKYDFTDDDISDIITPIRSINTVKVAVSIKETSKAGIYSISSRSNTSEIDVGSLCAAVGGGGHVRAAGARISAHSPKDALEQMIALFSKPFEK